MISGVIHQKMSVKMDSLDNVHVATKHNSQEDNHFEESLPFNSTPVDAVPTIHSHVTSPSPALTLHAPGLVTLVGDNTFFPGKLQRQMKFLGMSLLRWISYLLDLCAA